VGQRREPDLDLTRRGEFEISSITLKQPERHPVAAPAELRFKNGLYFFRLAPVFDKEESDVALSSPGSKARIANPITVLPKSPANLINQRPIALL
jgi:hypothetical protein